MSAILEAALRWLREGAAIVPLAPRLVPGKSGKLNPQPLVAWKTGALRAEREVRDFWSKRPDAQLAIVLGRGLACVDVDRGHEVPVDRPEPASFPGGYEETTKSGGRHLVFRHESELPPGTNPRRTGLGGYIDVLADGLLVVAPSRFENAPRPYEATTEGTVPVYASVFLALTASSSWLAEEWRRGTSTTSRDGGEVTPRATPPAASVTDVLERMRSSGPAGRVAAWISEHSRPESRDRSLCIGIIRHALDAGASAEQAAEVVGCDDWTPAQISGLKRRPPPGLDRLLSTPEGRAAETALDAAPAHRKLPIGDEIAWSVPGDGDRTDEFCGTVTHYGHTTVDGERHYRTAPHSCNRRECPTCFGRTAHREAHAAERQVYGLVHPGAAAKARGEVPIAEKWDRRPFLVTIRPPPERIRRLVSVGEYTAELRPTAYRKARRHGVTGGALVLHLDPEPTFYSVAFIAGTHPVAPGEDRDGWSVELKAIRGSVFEVLRWLHARAAVPFTSTEVTLAEGPSAGVGGPPSPSAKVTPRVHSVTWFGDLSYASRDHVEPVPSGVVCEVCDEFVAFGLWVRQIWVGKGPPPRGHGVCKDEEWVEDPLSFGGRARGEWSSGSEIERAVGRFGPNMVYPDGTVVDRRSDRVVARRRRGGGFDPVVYEEQRDEWGP